MADTQLASFGNESSLGGIRRGPYISTSGNWYCMLGQLNTPNGNTIIPNKSTNNGASWTALTGQTGTILFGGLGDSIISSAWFAQSTHLNRIYGLFITSQPGPTNFQVRVAYFTMDTDTWTVLATQPGLSRNNTPFGNEDITVDSSGNITIYLSEWIFNIPEDSFRAAYQDYNQGSGTWGTLTEIPEQGNFPNPDTPNFAQFFYISQAIFSNSGRVFVFIIDGQGTQPVPNPSINGYCITRETNGTWNTLQQIVIDIPNIPDVGIPQFGGFGLGIAWTGGIVLPQLKGTQSSGALTTLSLQGLHCTDIANPIFTQKLIDPDPANGNFLQRPQRFPIPDWNYSICLDQTNGNKPIIFYSSITSLNGSNQPNAGDIRYSQYSGTAWDTPATYRTFTVPHLPAGVYAFGINPPAAMYFRPFANNIIQTDMLHFLGAGIVPNACPCYLPCPGGIAIAQFCTPCDPLLTCCECIG